MRGEQHTWTWSVVEGGDEENGGDSGMVCTCMAVIWDIGSEWLSMSSKVGYCED